MGAEILIRLSSDAFDSKNQAPFLGREFHWEIARGYLWKNKITFLSKEESKLLDAPHIDTLGEGYGAAINPKTLIKIFTKIKIALKKHKNIFPFEIIIDYDKMEKNGLDYLLEINGSHCWIQGDSFTYNVDEKVKIVNFGQEKEEVNLWVPTKTEITIEDKVYYLKKIYRYEIYETIIKSILDFCNKAIDLDDKVYWVYSH